MNALQVAGSKGVKASNYAKKQIETETRRRY